MLRTALLTGLAAAAGSHAQTQADSASPLPLWEAGLGAGAVTTPAYPGAAGHSSRVLALPVLLYRGTVLRADQSGIGARLVRTDGAEVDMGFAGALPARARDVAARAGMPDLGTLIEFGPRLKLTPRALGPGRRLRFELPARAVMEARGGLHHRGWTVEPRVVYEMRSGGGRWVWEGQLGAVAGDRSINRYFYAVEPAYATAWRPAYQARAGWMLWRTGVFAAYRMHPDVRLFGFVRYELYGGAANQHSPLVQQTRGTSAGFGVQWTLARSGQRGRD